MTLFELESTESALRGLLSFIAALGLLLRFLISPTRLDLVHSLVWMLELVHRLLKVGPYLSQFTSSLEGKGRHILLEDSLSRLILTDS